jgi:hypothetical protein
MRWFFGRSRMVQRTCLACGETWTLGAGEAHMRVQARPRSSYGYSPRGVAAQYVFREPVGASAAERDQEVETIRQLRTCPNCGGDHYKDRRFRTEIG